MGGRSYKFQQTKKNCVMQLLKRTSFRFIEWIRMTSTKIPMSLVFNMAYNVVLSTSLEAEHAQLSLIATTAGKDFFPLFVSDYSILKHSNNCNYLVKPNVVYATQIFLEHVFHINLPEKESMTGISESMRKKNIISQGLGTIITYLYHPPHNFNYCQKRTKGKNAI